MLPAIVGGVTWGHVALARKLGPTPLHGRERSSVPRWPEQTLRNAIAIAMVLAVLLVYVVAVHGVDLAAPADPSQSYDARPLWYFRWLFELRELAGRGEKIVALVVPAVVAGALVALPLVDRGPSRALRTPAALPRRARRAARGDRRRSPWRRSSRDARNDKLAERVVKADQRAQLARRLARDNGVPATGGADVFMTAPMAQGRALFAHPLQELPRRPRARTARARSSRRATATATGSRRSSRTRGATRSGAGPSWPRPTPR